MIIILLIKRRKHSLFTLWKLSGSSIEHTWIPFTQGRFVPNLVEIDPVVLGKKMKMWKVYDDKQQHRRQRHRWRILIRKAHLSLRLSWAKKGLLSAIIFSNCNHFMVITLVTIATKLSELGLMWQRPKATFYCNA